MARTLAEAIMAEYQTTAFILLPEREQHLFRLIGDAAFRHEIVEFRNGTKPMNLAEIRQVIRYKEPGIIEQDEPDFETAMENLQSVGLLAKTSDGTIYCPALAKSQTRAEASRNNGLLGGRPKKQAASAGNITQISRSAAGREKTRERENRNLGQNDTAYLLKESTKEVKISKCGIEDDEYHSVGRAALDAAGFDSSIGFRSYALVRQWLADGADREMIIDIIERKTGPHVTTLAYFNKAIAEAIAAKPPPEPQWEKDFRRAQALWELTRDGPSPRLADFKPKAVA